MTSAKGKLTIAYLGQRPPWTEIHQLHQLIWDLFLMPIQFEQTAL